MLYIHGCLIRKLHISDLNAVFGKELHFTEMCLQINVKS